MMENRNGLAVNARVTKATGRAEREAAVDMLGELPGKLLMTRILRDRHEISELFVAHLLSRNIRYETDLVGQFFNSTEKRLARILLQLSHFGKQSGAELVLPRVNQANLAQMVGTTRSRVSHFMNKFRKLGFIDFSNNHGLTVCSGLLSVVLHDQYPSGIQHTMWRI